MHARQAGDAATPIDKRRASSEYVAVDLRGRSAVSERVLHLYPRGPRPCCGRVPVGVVDGEALGGARGKSS